MWHSHLNDMEISETKHFIPKEFELGTTLSQPNWPIKSRVKDDCSRAEIIGNRKRQMAIN